MDRRSRNILGMMDGMNGTLIKILIIITSKIQENVLEMFNKLTTLIRMHTLFFPLLGNLHYI